MFVTLCELVYRGARRQKNKGGPKKSFPSLISFPFLFTLPYLYLLLPPPFLFLFTSVSLLLSLFKCATFNCEQAFS